ncbi:MAG: formate/nitrite transporter family protein [Janthinobacterium lividum]
MNETITPARIVGSMIDAGAVRAKLATGPLFVRSALAGAFLGVATTLAFTVLAQTGLPIVGALIFPVGFAMIVVLGLDLITGSFALLPMAVIAGRATVPEMLRNWAITFVGNYVGALILAVLMWVALTSAGHDAGGPIGDKLRGAVAARSAGYEALGMAGLLTVFVKAMLCNWMVCLGVTMGLSATTSAGKIVACWLPIVIFFAQGFEHAVVNMALFPLGLMLGAPASVAQYLLWNELPVTLGNLVGGFLFTGLALYASYGRDAAAAPLRTGLPPLAVAS